MYREWGGEQHIAMAERHLMTQRRLVERRRADVREKREAERLLETMEQILEAYRGRRQNILDTLARIDSDRA